MSIYSSLVRSSVVCGVGLLVLGEICTGTTVHLCMLVLGNVCLLFALAKVDAAGNGPEPMVAKSSTVPDSIVTEKRIQQQILRTSKSMCTLRAMVSNLLRIFSEHSANWNVIHATTVMHTLAGLGASIALVGSESVWAEFVEKSSHLIAHEKTHLRSAVSLAGMLWKLAGDSAVKSAVEQLVAQQLEAMDASLLVQLIYLAHQMHVPADGVFDGLVAVGGPLRQTDVLCLISLKRMHIGLLDGVAKFECDGIGSIFNWVKANAGDKATEVVREIRARVGFDKPVWMKASMGDLVPLAVSRVAEVELEVYISRFFEFSSCGFLSDVALSPELVSLLERRTEEYLVRAKDWDRVQKALLLLISNGSKNCDQIIRQFDPYFPPNLLLTLMRISGYNSAYFVRVVAAMHAPSFSDLLPVFDVVLASGPDELFRSIRDNLLSLDVPETGSVLPSLVIAVVAGLVDRGDDVLLKKFLNGKYHRLVRNFSPRNTVDALNWIVAVRAVDAAAERIQDALEILREVKVVPGALFPALRAFKYFPTVGDLLNTQLDMAHIVAVVAVLPQCKFVMARATAALRANTLSVSQIAQILEHAGGTEGDDEFMHALQQWLVPRIDTLSLEEVTLITKAFHVTSTPSEISTCDETLTISDMF